MENQRYVTLLLIMLMIASCRSAAARAMVTPKKFSGGFLVRELGYTKSKELVTVSKAKARSGPNRKGINPPRRPPGPRPPGPRPPRPRPPRPS